MTFDDPTDLELPRMPAWITRGRAETAEDMACLAGAALAHLDVVLRCPGVPGALLRDRLALQAAEACMVMAGRIERAGALRDAVHLLRAGDHPGPAGAVLMQWRRAVERPVSAAALARALPGQEAGRLGGWLDGSRGVAVRRAAEVLETVLQDAPGEDVVALVLADAGLARGLGWKYAVPLLAVGLKPRDLRKTGEALRLACYRAVGVSARDTVVLAQDLLRRADRLRAVVPKLRAKPSEAAAEMFLTRDAVTPADLTALMSDRAARRFCDRLVTLGVARELSGRESFRLYGL